MKSQDSYMVNSQELGSLQPNHFWCNNILTGSNTFNNTYAPSMAMMQKSNDYGMINEPHDIAEKLIK